MKELVVAALVVVAAVGPVAVGGGADRSTEPLADAGLDQSVEQGTTVLLDGSGSRDPDGRIVEYEWRIETPSGSVVSPRNRTAARTTFVADSNGRYVVTLTVTDDAGGVASDSLYVDVESGATPSPTPSSPSTPAPPSSPNPPEQPETPTPPPPTAATPADRSPSVRGPRLVTGERPLAGEYAIATTGTVEEVVWRVDGGNESSGTTLSRTWSPGNHTLSAVVSYADGTSEVATFEGGTRRVVADPRPELSVSDVVSREQLAGTATATDGYGNLESVEVNVDGLGTERTVVDEGSHSVTTFDWTDVEPGREYHLTIEAVDARGQRTTLNRTLRVVAPPETRSAEFVNGPVDSFHPRIDSERYTAHHVLKIDLNGHQMAEIGVDIKAEEPSIVRRVSDQKVDVTDGVATIHTYWAGESPSLGTPYAIKYIVEANSRVGSGPSIDGESEFSVTPSKPEIRIEMRNDGTRPVGGPGSSPPVRAPLDMRESVIVDASESFDPDGTALTYIWENGAEATEPDDSVGRLSGWESGKLVLEDNSGARAYQNWSAKKTIVPSVASMEVVEQGPFSADERVRVHVKTQLMQFRRGVIDVEIGAELRGAQGEVVEWNERYTDTINSENDLAYEGTVELPASALAKNGPDARIVLYNVDRPDYTRTSTSLPTVELTSGLRTGRGSLEVTDLRYVIRKETAETEVATSRAEMQRLIDAGYEVTNTDPKTIGYRIEEHVQTQEEIVDTDSRAFGSSYNRRLFLKTHPKWTADGVRIDRDRVSTTHTAWKRSTGRGFTGKTRRVRTDPAEYSVEREYVYTTVEPRTREITSYQCPFRGRCYEVTYERTVYRDVTHTYWAHSKHLSHHSATGDVRRTLVDPAEYKTEFQHEYTTWRTETDRDYVASHTTVVQPARYQWQVVDTVSNRRVAWRMVSGDSDYRIGEEVTERRWTMERRSTKNVIRPAYTSQDIVIGTRATVSGSIIRYRDRASGPGTARIVNEFTTDFDGRGVLSKADIKERVRESEVGK